MELVVAGTNLTPQQLARQAGLSVGGMVYTQEEWKPQESYFVRLRKHQEKLASLCTVPTKSGWDCDRKKADGEAFCEGHRKTVGKAVGDLMVWGR